MGQASFDPSGPLTQEERHLLSRLHEVPAGAARQQLFELLEDLVEFVRDPRCPESQADGVPCLSLALACEQCQLVTGVLAGLHRRLRRGA